MYKPAILHVCIMYALKRLFCRGIILAVYLGELHNHYIFWKPKNPFYNTNERLN